MMPRPISNISTHSGENDANVFGVIVSVLYEDVHRSFVGYDSQPHSHGCDLLMCLGVH